MRKEHFLILIIVILAGCQAEVKTWEVTITDVSRETKIDVRDGARIKTHTPYEGDAFIVVHTTIVNLKPVLEFSTHFVSIVNEDGEIFTPVGAYDPGIVYYCMNCAPKITYSGGEFEPGKKFEFGFVFLIEEEDLDQEFIFQVQNENLGIFTIPAY